MQTPSVELKDIRIHSGVTKDAKCNGLDHVLKQELYKEVPETFINLNSITWSYIEDIVERGSNKENKLGWLKDIQPGNSPDLNPTENMWSILKKRVDKQKHRNCDQLQAFIRQEWVAISQDFAQKLISSLPR
ncbi:hypothetical protein P4O66_013448 [Electrophorus voltai]|uniref:Tc1-like transposase DDE domain-containing protein n=1 Tax=Electrophorus voltai TaxID=2609070 RepID=A0AAD9DST1_9TELE|nr:hypothetical protein P4O66_013448 [Electrophorus voltai]